jgi:MFS family permease
MSNPILGLAITASKVQLTTYLLGVCLFSISFLVYLNSSISFVITERIGQKEGVGDAVGTLGFADELLALVGCPIWGTLSDKIGVRPVAVTGYVIIGLSLVTFVQATNVYPQLLLARLFFAIGGSAVSTMVTAILPTMTAQEAQGSRMPKDSSITSSKLAGYVGMFTGFGALLALTVFLPLPALFSNHGLERGPAIAYSFYLVGLISLLVGILCFFGLRHLPTEQDKS